MSDALTVRQRGAVAVADTDGKYNEIQRHGGSVVAWQHTLSALKDHSRDVFT